MMLVAAVPLLSSCELSNERGRTAVEITAVNNGGVFIAAMLDLNNTANDPSDDFVPAGHVPITVKNRAGNAFITATENSPFGQFHITTVQVVWTAAPAAALPELQAFNYQAGYDVAIPINGEATFNVVIAPFAMKEQPFFQGLRTGATEPFMATAEITLTGHDSGSERDVTLKGTILTEFIGEIISSDD
jgi:hypothetical protein